MGSVAATAHGVEALQALTEVVTAPCEGLPGMLDAARSGNPEAFVSLVRRFEKPVYHLILRMVRRPCVAEDLSQDVFIRLWRNLAKFRTAETLPAWLRQVAVHAVIDHWRKQDARDRKLQVLREHPVARRAVRPSSRMETREAMDALDVAMRALPPKLRGILLLRAAEGLSYEELADVLGLSASAVRSRLFRARQELEESLKREKAADFLDGMYRRRPEQAPQ